MSVCDFDTLVLNAVDEVLSGVGVELSGAVYSNLERLNIRKREIPSKIEVFAKTIEKLLGSGAIAFEICIAKQLYDKVGMLFEQSHSNKVELNEYVRRARERVYTEYVDSIQNGLAVFHLENPEDLNSFQLVSINTMASKLMGVNRERAVRQRISDICPQLFPDYVKRILEDVLTYERTKVVARFRYRDEDGHEKPFSVTAFPLSSNCIGLAFKMDVEVQPDSQKRPAGKDLPVANRRSDQKVASKTAEAHSMLLEPELLESITVSANLDGKNWAKFQEAVIQPLTDAGAKLKIHVEVSGTSDDGILLNTVDCAMRSLLENNIAVNVETKERTKKP